MSTLPLVSVIMPCYNDGLYIRESVTSFREQTYPNLELLIIDDGSDDPATISVLDDLRNDRSIRFLSTDHLGPSAARNKGISEASGTYIMSLDSDDLIDRTYIEKCVRTFQDFPECSVVYCCADFFGEKNGPWDLPEFTPERMLMGNIVFNSAMYPKALWEQIGGYRTSMVVGLEDYDFWLSCLERGAQFFRIPEILFHYRIKPQSRSSSFESDLDRHCLVYQQIYENHQELFLRYAAVLLPAMHREIATLQHLSQHLQGVVRDSIQLSRIPVVGSLLSRWNKKRLSKKLQRLQGSADAG